jgi:hypothetical protein
VSVRVAICVHQLGGGLAGGHLGGVQAVGLGDDGAATFYRPLDFGVGVAPRVGE